jgi:hypothetical protein
MNPLGSLLAGSLTEEAGVHFTLRALGATIAASGAVFAATLAPRLHRRATELFAGHVHTAAVEAEAA